jgi:hypothetical protein
MKLLPCLMLASVTLVFAVTAQTAELKNDPCRPAESCIRSDMQKIPAFYARFRVPISAAIAACRVAEPTVCKKDGPELIHDARLETAEGVQWLFVPIGVSGIVDQCTAVMDLGFPANVSLVGLPGGHVIFVPCRDQTTKSIARYDGWRRHPIDLQALSALGFTAN